MLDPNKEYQTRDGSLRFKYLGDWADHPSWKDRGGASFFVCIQGNDRFNAGNVFTRIVGGQTPGSYGANPMDIIPVVEKTSKWRNVWTISGASTYDHETKEEAIISDELGLSRLGFLELSYEDGVFVDAVFHAKETS